MTRAGVETVAVDDVTHDVPGRPGILHDVRLRVGAGEFVALAGRSGSGKSTLCHLVAGASAPTRGAVTVLGAPATSWTDWTRVSLLPQRLALVPELTVQENVEWPCRLAGTPVAADVVEHLGLGHLVHRPAGETSVGEQQRTALARALAPAPDLAVLDEPTAHQDDANVERVISALVGRDRGTALLVATHDERILGIADRVVRLEGGRVLG